MLVTSTAPAAQSLTALIFGCCSDKDVPGMLEKITFGADKVIFTKVDNVRTADPAELAGLTSDQVREIHLQHYAPVAAAGRLLGAIRTDARMSITRHR